ncbi:MAG: GspH/FimT family pseudopilin [Kiritimatiellae bacterium]|nr:GspH/FimT family pseudopilin [Kiritimatiellia bacterium]
MSTERRPRAGFTAIEMAMVAAIVGLLALFVISDYLRQRPRQLLMEATLKVATDMRAARMQAISENVPVVVAFDAASKRYTIWGDSNTNGVVDPGERETQSLNANPDLSVAVNAVQGTFSPGGAFQTAPGYAEIQLAVAEAGTRYVRILPYGHVDWSDEDLP